MVKKMRINLRLKIKNFTIFFMASHTQTLRGIMSKTREGKHYVFFDIENKCLNEVLETLEYIQSKYCLSNMYIMSDCPKSFRVFCFNKVSFLHYIHILSDFQLGDMIDFNFIHWTIVRGKSTLRISNKKGREKQKQVAILKSYYLPIPEEIEYVQYDTGIHKTGNTIIIKVL